jgi:hypothetical protein
MIAPSGIICLGFVTIGFSLGHKPKERARTKGTESQRGQWGRANLLPLPRKSSEKQDETRAIRMGYVIEIEGTTRKPDET